MSNPVVRMIEVGPRDGLQNESAIWSLEQKLELIRRLVEAGCRDIEVGAMMRHDRVPAMAQSEELFRAVQSSSWWPKTARAWVLIPNSRGMERALAAGVTQFALMTSVSKTFNEKNIGLTPADSGAWIRSVLPNVSKDQVRVYVSTVFSCPYEKRVDESNAVDELLSWLMDDRVGEVSIGDTLGNANPLQVRSLLTKLRDAVRPDQFQKIAMHFHDTRGMALLNIWCSYELGVRSFDSSIGGLGGCPYAPGASGNVATEDVVSLFRDVSVDSSLTLEGCVRAVRYVESVLERRPTSRVYQAESVRCAP